MKALALQFPRERNGRFLRAALWVALASLDGAPRHLCGRWLTVRAKANVPLEFDAVDVGSPPVPTPLAERALAARQHRAGARP